MVISGRKLLYIQIKINLIIKLISYIIPKLSFVEYIIDALNVVLLCIIILKLVKTKKIVAQINKVLIFIVLFFLYCLVQAMITGPNIILFLWALRNHFRFLIIFISACVFWNMKDIENIFNVFYKCLMLNVVIISIQFAMGYRGDYLGGTFGLDKNCNAITNIFLCMMVIYGILGRLYKVVETKITLSILLASVYWAALAEIKIFYVELVVITIIIMLLVKGRAYTKLKWISMLIIVFVVGVLALAYAFPEQVAFITNPKNIIWYLQNVHGGAHGFGRTTAISITNDVFFNNNILLKVFGIGIGNAEVMNIGAVSIASNFYNTYSIYAYFGYFHAMVYIELGVIGLIWYFLFWSKYVLLSLKNRRRSNYYKMWMEFSIVFSVCIMINALKDSTLRISISGYLAFILMAIPYIGSKISIDTK